MSAGADMIDFARWARETLVPLSGSSEGLSSEDARTFGDMIGNASVVALGEGVHLAAEPLEFRNRLFEFLVQEKGFTAIAIESGLIEGRLVHDYVRGGPGDLHAVVAQGIGWSFDRLPQNESLIRWLRQHNCAHRQARKINFYGFDMLGSPGEPSANQGLATGLSAALQYLPKVDATAGAAFHARLDSFLAKLRFDPGISGDDFSYDGLSQADRDRLTSAIADLIALLESRQLVYSAAGTADEYEWAHRAAVGARQVDAYLRQFPIGWRSTGGKARVLFEASEVREQAMADNLDWIVQREGASGKVLVYAHSAHVSAAPATTAWWPADPKAPRTDGMTGTHASQMSGIYLRQHFGDRLITIANIIGRGQCGHGGHQQLLERSTPESIPGLAEQIGERRYWLDLRLAPPPLAMWLGQERELAPQENYEPFGLSVVLRLEAARAFDVLLYLGPASLAGPADCAGDSAKQ